MFEVVHTLTDWYDGPRRGIADYCGQPHVFESEWQDGAALDAETFLLMPIAAEIFSLALEEWAIWRRWETAFHQGKATRETHPALPEDSHRHDELERLLEGRLAIDPARAVRKRARFRGRSDPHWSGYGWHPMEVCWDSASTTIPPMTDRLIFRDWNTTDLEAFQSICSDPAVMRFVGDGEPWSLERTQQWIDQAIEMSRTSGFCLWALNLRETSTLVGFCGFRTATDGTEIGWRLAQACWGRGLATEAARTVLHHGLEKIGFDRVFANVQSPNRASIRVCEKIGLKPESSFQRNGREVLVYSINRGQEP